MRKTLIKYKDLQLTVNDLPDVYWPATLPRIYREVGHMLHKAMLKRKAEEEAEEEAEEDEEEDKEDEEEEGEEEEGDERRRTKKARRTNTPKSVPRWTRSRTTAAA